jgi:type II secretory pathway pseudopilin PulG
MHREAHRGEAGFTLVELLIIIGIISILFAVTLIAVDPARRFSESRDAVRRQDVRSLLEAIVTYITDNGGNYPANLDTVAASIQVLGTNGSGCNATTCAGYPVANMTASCSNLSGSLVETYLAAIPTDPLNGTAGNTRYYVNRTAGNRIEVGSCDPERVTSIAVKR